MAEYIQFKMSTGDDVVCEILQEPEDDDIYIVVRNALKVTCTEATVSEDGEESYRYYGFRPWMVFQGSNEYMQLINFNHIIGEAKPDSMLLDHYKKALEAEHERAGDKKLEDEYESDSLTLLRSLLDGAEDDGEEVEVKTHDGNIVSFNPKKTIH